MIVVPARPAMLPVVLDALDHIREVAPRVVAMSKQLVMQGCGRHVPLKLVDSLDDEDWPLVEASDLVSIGAAGDTEPIR